MKVKKVFVWLVLAGSVLTLGACNRGYGCPTNLKAKVSQVTHMNVQQVLAILR